MELQSELITPEPESDTVTVEQPAMSIAQFTEAAAAKARFRLIVRIILRFYFDIMAELDKDSFEVIIYKMKQDPAYVPTETELRFLEHLWSSPRYGGIPERGATIVAKKEKSLKSLNFDVPEKDR